MVRVDPFIFGSVYFLLRLDGGDHWPIPRRDDLLAEILRGAQFTGRYE